MSKTLGTTPSAAELRQRLVDMVLRNLQGPAGGEDEVITDRSVSECYLVGTLAPRKHEIHPDTMDPVEFGGSDSPDDGSPDGSVPAAKSMFPSSFGMTFAVGLDAESLEFTARWGRYAKEGEGDDDEDTDRPSRPWRRQQFVRQSPPIPLADGRHQWQPFDEIAVTVDYIIRKREDHWSVTAFLVNGQEEGTHKRSEGKDSLWLFQPELSVRSPDGRAIFHRRPTRRQPGKGDNAGYLEYRKMEMLYRHHVEFAAGHGVGVHVELPEGVTDHARRISTMVVPEYEVPQTTPPDEQDIPGLADLVCDMKELSETATADFPAKLGALVTEYRRWIDAREKEAMGEELADFADVSGVVIKDCREALGRIEEGLRLIGEEEQAAEAFRFANRAMWQQRVHSLYARANRRKESPVMADIDVAKNRSWRPFQLAFVLLNLPGLTRLDHSDRTDGDQAIADLLWFPTGGGKTEAYLGLAAYTMAIRRLQGHVEGRSGEHGLAVLMRYTLRLLTLQQFQRASALICACELIRQDDPAKWGKWPFRIGLWVGMRTTPNTTEQAAKAAGQSHDYSPSSAGGGVGDPAQLKSCPWCGTEIAKGRHIRVETGVSTRNRTFIYCGDEMGECPFSARKSPDEGLPVVVVDEEIYRLLPAMVIATVDKFAQMPWKGQVQMLFGQVNGLCERHGFRSPEIDDSDSHRANAQKGLPAAKTVSHGPLRPPDLIIQDELHLISGPLGTMVGLYETAVDALCSWEVGGRMVRPKVIASTATIRRAPDQVYRTFLRQVRIFPPPGLDVRDGFFARQRTPCDETPGRLYLGICAPGRRLKAALIRVYLAFLSAAQKLYDDYGKDADPWMTLTGYFNAMRELGGTRRLVEDDIRTRLQRMDERGLAKRTLLMGDAIEELTSRKGATQIPDVLDRLEIPFDPAVEEARKQARGKGRGARRQLAPRPIDVLLATNMVSVGVDVPRLGLMVVAGQPKTTAEYIQATSRVGRQSPGIVCTVYNWARPRDLSHYETFEHYHASFYKHVEALSVTPFAAGAIDKGLTALLVSAIRLRGTTYNPNQSAGGISWQASEVICAIDAIVARALSAGDVTGIDQQVRNELKARVDAWLAMANGTTGGIVLGYKKQNDRRTVGLLEQPGLGPWRKFTCPNSLRDVEPNVGLILADWGLDEVSVAAPGQGINGMTGGDEA